MTTPPAKGAYVVVAQDNATVDRRWLFFVPIVHGSDTVPVLGTDWYLVSCGGGR